jgi:hypothetical protein
MVFPIIGIFKTKKGYLLIALLIWNNPEVLLRRVSGSLTPLFQNGIHS